MVLRDFQDLGSTTQLAQKLDGEPVPGLRMTEAQFHDWCDEDTRAEWVNGEVILLSPCSVPEIRLNLWLFGWLQAVADVDDAGEVFGIETQIRLPTIRRRRNPDVLFITRARQKIVKQTYIDGPPDLIMEIVSADSESRDWR